MTYGDWVAVPLPLSRLGSLNGTSMPVMRIPRM